MIDGQTEILQRYNFAATRSNQRVPSHATRLHSYGRISTSA